MGVIAALLLAILITLLNAWSIVGYALLAIIAIGVVCLCIAGIVKAISKLFEALDWLFDRILPQRAKRIFKPADPLESKRTLKKAIKRRAELG